MAVDSLRELFAYDLGISYETEVSSVGLYKLLAMRVTDETLEEIMRELEQSKQRQVGNIGTCLNEMGSRPLQSPSPTVQGLRQRFDDFREMQPSPEAMDLFAVWVAGRSERLSVINYEEMIDLARLLGENRCEESLRANFDASRADLTRLEQYAPEVQSRVPAVE